MKNLYRLTALAFAASLSVAVGCGSAMGGSGGGCGMGDNTVPATTADCQRGQHEDPQTHKCVADSSAQKNRVQNSGHTSTGEP